MGRLSSMWIHHLTDSNKERIKIDIFCCFVINLGWSTIPSVAWLWLHLNLGVKLTLQALMWLHIYYPFISNWTHPLHCQTCLLWFNIQSIALTILLLILAESTVPRWIGLRGTGQATIVCTAKYIISLQGNVWMSFFLPNRPTGPIWSSSCNVSQYLADFLCLFVSCPLPMQFFLGFSLVMWPDQPGSSLLAGSTRQKTVGRINQVADCGVGDEDEDEIPSYAVLLRY